MTEDLFWTLICMCYMVGGITIGYYLNSWLNRKKNNRSGTGRWDYKDRHLGDDKYK